MAQNADASRSLPPQVVAFAIENGVSRYLPVAIELAREAFGSSGVTVSISEDTEDEAHQYIALDVDVAGMSDTALSSRLRRVKLQQEEVS